MKTKQQLEQDLIAIDNAISKLISGEKLRKFSIGSGDFINTYEYHEITYDMLMKLRKITLQELAVLCPQTIKYRQSSVPLVVTKC